MQLESIITILVAQLLQKLIHTHPNYYIGQPNAVLSPGKVAMVAGATIKTLTLRDPINGWSPRLVKCPEMDSRNKCFCR